MNASFRKPLAGLASALLLLFAAPFAVADGAPVVGEPTNCWDCSNYNCYIGLDGYTTCTASHGPDWDMCIATGDLCFSGGLLEHDRNYLAIDGALALAAEGAPAAPGDRHGVQAYPTRIGCQGVVLDRTAASIAAETIRATTAELSI